MAQKMMQMYHPGIPHTLENPTSVSESAFTLAWSTRGWLRSNTPSDGTPSEDDPVDDSEPKLGRKSKKKSEAGADDQNNDSEQ